MNNGIMDAKRHGEKARTIESVKVCPLSGKDCLEDACAWWIVLTHSERQCAIRSLAQEFHLSYIYGWKRLKE